MGSTKTSAAKASDAQKKAGRAQQSEKKVQSQMRQCLRDNFGMLPEEDTRKVPFQGYTLTQSLQADTEKALHGPRSMTTTH